MGEQVPSRHRAVATTSWRWAGYLRSVHANDLGDGVAVLVGARPCMASTTQSRCGASAPRARPSPSWQTHPGRSSRRACKCRGWCRALWHKHVQDRDTWESMAFSVMAYLVRLSRAKVGERASLTSLSVGARPATAQGHWPLRSRLDGRNSLDLDGRTASRRWKTIGHGRTWRFWCCSRLSRGMAEDSRLLRMPADDEAIAQTECRCQARGRVVSRVRFDMNTIWTRTNGGPSMTSPSGALRSAHMHGGEPKPSRPWRHRASYRRAPIVACFAASRRLNRRPPSRTIRVLAEFACSRIHVPEGTRVDRHTPGVGSLGAPQLGVQRHPSLCGRARPEERCEAIRDAIEATASEYEKDKLKERLAKLSGGVAVIKVGGASEVEVNEVKDRLNDALCATKAALEEGIVPGGGTALLYAAQTLETLKLESLEQQVGRGRAASVERGGKAPALDGGLLVSAVCRLPIFRKVWMVEHRLLCGTLGSPPPRRWRAAALVARPARAAPGVGQRWPWLRAGAPTATWRNRRRLDRQMALQLASHRHRRVSALASWPLVLFELCLTSTQCEPSCWMMVV